MSEVIVEVPWYHRGEMGEYLCDCVGYRLYTLDNSDWGGLANDARKAGLSESEVQDFLQLEREGF